MPLFSRPDGDPVANLPAMRRIMPYVMRGRNESAVYVPAKVDITKTKKWLWAYNRQRSEAPCTLLHLTLYLARQFLDEFPQLNRFVVGRTIYQRTDSSISLVVKESLEASAPTYTIKLPLKQGAESLPEFSARLADSFSSARECQQRTEETVSKLLVWPEPIVRLSTWMHDRLDRWNLLPRRWIEDDPLCTSLFLSNLGSLGVPEAFHHLYETGTCSAFVVMGSPRKEAVVDWDGSIKSREVVSFNWTLDDRIVDGFQCAVALRWLQDRLEDPSLFLGRPEDAANGIMGPSGSEPPNTGSNGAEAARSRETPALGGGRVTDSPSPFGGNGKSGEKPSRFP